MLLFLRDVVTRQTKQLPPKSLQIKGDFAHDGKKDRLSLLDTKCFGNSCTPAQQLCDDVSCSFAKLPARCGNSEQCNQV